jgi:hypothetical protein
MTPHGAGSLVRSLHASALVITIALAGFHLWQLLGLVRGSTLAPLLAGALLGVLMADLASGLVHWACDTWGSEHTPLIGSGLIQFFREHHRSPRAMLQHDSIEVSGELGLAAAPCMAALALAAVRLDLASHPFAYAFCWAFVAVGAFANQLHQWAHMERPPRPVRTLQRRGLILSRGRHAKHHRPPHTRGYCISTGWLNVTLDAVRFWRFLEWSLTRITGARPRGDTDSLRDTEAGH